jgi:hypothetical protein
MKCLLAKVQKEIEINKKAFEKAARNVNENTANWFRDATDMQRRKWGSSVQRL